MNKLIRMISGARARTRRRADPLRKAREEEAKRLAAARGFEIERTRSGAPGYIVWPPSDLAEDLDPYKGSWFCATWDEVLERAKVYAATVRAAP